MPKILCLLPGNIPGQEVEIEESLLFKREGGHDDENETAAWVEYYQSQELQPGYRVPIGKPVHRSARVELKKVPINTSSFTGKAG